MKASLLVSNRLYKRYIQCPFVVNVTNYCVSHITRLSHSLTAPHSPPREDSFDFLSFSFGSTVGRFIRALVVVFKKKGHTNRQGRFTFRQGNSMVVLFEGRTFRKFDLDKI